jgi:CRP-like cAMP-binding protein
MSKATTTHLATLELALLSLRKVMNSYALLTDATWQSMSHLVKLRVLAKGDILYCAGDISHTFAFVYQGLIRCYITDNNGDEYNKVFFEEGKFPGAMTALLTSSKSQFTFEAIEHSVVIEIDFVGYRALLVEKDDLKLFQIYYLEKNWLIAKDSREVEIIQEDATMRYQRFVNENPTLASRLPQYHIASHLGITPTQLSRVRKKLSIINLCK